VVGICGVILVYVFIVLSRVAFMHLAEEQNQLKVIASHPRSLLKYYEEQQTKLGGGYRWTSDKKTAVHLPIDVAMAKVTHELASSPKAAPAPESTQQ
jgi:hypothetical protein